MDNLSSKQRIRFKNSNTIENWFEFTPYSESTDEDLEILESFAPANLIVRLNLRTEYCPSGFDISDKETLLKFSKFKGLEICSHFSDLSFISNFSQLEYLKVFGLVNHDLSMNSKIDLDFSKLKMLKYLSIPIIRHRKENYNFQTCSSLKHLFWPNHYKATTSFLDSIGGMLNLEVLSMHRPKFIALDGINKLNDLRYLEIDYAKNLSNISDLAGCSSLTGLDLQNCPNLKDLSALTELDNLKILNLWNCRNIDSLGWLQDTQVEYLNFYSSNIIDGDLSFISNMPNLKYLRFENKRHYNKKQRDFEHLPQMAPSGVLVWDYYKQNFSS